MNRTDSGDERFHLILQARYQERHVLAILHEFLAILNETVIEVDVKSLRPINRLDRPSIFSALGELPQKIDCLGMGGEGLSAYQDREGVGITRKRPPQHLAGLFHLAALNRRHEILGILLGQFQIILDHAKERVTHSAELMFLLTSPLLASPLPTPQHRQSSH